VKPRDETVSYTQQNGPLYMGGAGGNVAAKRV